MNHFIIRILSLLAGVLAVCCILSGVPACGRDTLLSCYDKVLQAGGALALTPDAALQGARTGGTDGYTGAYTAVYRDFTGTEVLFGGTALNRAAGDTVSVACTLHSGGGHAEIRFHPGSSAPQTLLKNSGVYSGALALPGGSNSIEIVLDGFSGEIEMNVS